jgi:hypothetical protein
VGNNTSVTALLGKYENHQYDAGGKNNWHYVTITKIDDKKIKWTNRAGVSWTLTITDDKNKLAVGSDCTYYNRGYKTATVKYDANGVVKSINGPNNEPYDRG